MIGVIAKGDDIMITVWLLEEIKLMLVVLNIISIIEHAFSPEITTLCTSKRLRLKLWWLLINSKYVIQLWFESDCLQSLGSLP